TSQISERAYAMCNYRFARWLQGGSYYSLFYPDVTRRSGRASYQHDLAATLRFDINAFWLIKLEGHFMAGTAGLQSTLNDNQPLRALAQYWGVVLVKTTVHF